MFATSHLWCSLPWWIHCPLACSVAKESQRTFHLCGERFSFVDWTTKSSFIRRSANFGNVSPFSSSSRGNKHIFRAYPSTLKIAELCFETTAANSTIIWSARLGSAFSLFEKKEQALSAYCHFHPLMFDLPENTTLYTETTLSPHLPYVFGHVRLTSLLLRCSYPTLNQFWKKTDCFVV